MCTCNHFLQASGWKGRRKKYGDLTGAIQSGVPTLELRFAFSLSNRAPLPKSISLIVYFSLNKICPPLTSIEREEDITISTPYSFIYRDAWCLIDEGIARLSRYFAMRRRSDFPVRSSLKNVAWLVLWADVSSDRDGTVPLQTKSLARETRPDR